MSEAGVEQSLRRIEGLIAALDSVPDPAGRESARALLEVVLDLHALALARMTGTIASAAGGAALLHRLAEDEPVRAILLLHGLHPQTVLERVGKAVEELRPQLAARGLAVRIVEGNATLARVRVRWIGDGLARTDTAVLREEIEAAIVEAAPDLETLEIEGLGQASPAVRDPAGRALRDLQSRDPDRARAPRRYRRPPAALRLPEMRGTGEPAGWAVSAAAAANQVVSRFPHDRRRVGFAANPDRHGVHLSQHAGRAADQALGQGTGGQRVVRVTGGRGSSTSGRRRELSGLGPNVRETA